MANQKGRDGNAQKNYYAAYQNKAEKQRKARLERHMKRHPNDKQGGSTAYRKMTPKEVSGWLTAQMDSLLTPVQTTPITVKDENGKKKTIIPECAESLKEMSKADRKRFAPLYARMRRVHNHATMYGKKRKKGSKGSK